MKSVCFVVGGGEDSTVYKSTALLAKLICGEHRVDIIFRKYKFFYVRRSCDKTIDKILVRVSVIALLSNLMNYLVRKFYWQSFFTLTFKLSHISYFKTRLRVLENYDYVGIQWVGGGVEALVPAIMALETTKVVIFHRDWWWLTAGCHVPNNLRCNSYRETCDQCLDKASIVVPWQTTSYRAKREWLDNKDVIHVVNRPSFANLIPSSIRNNIHVIPPYINEFASTASQGQQFKSNGKRVKVACIARHLTDPTKQIQHFIEKCVESNLPIDIHLVGEGSVFQTQSNLVIVNHGLLDKMDLTRVLQSMDYLVVVSQSETFGKTVLEALSVGTPVLTLLNPGLVDHAENFDGVEGFSSTDDLVHYISTLPEESDNAPIVTEADFKTLSLYDAKYVTEALYEVFK